VEGKGTSVGSILYEKENKGALWKRHSKRGAIIRVRVDDRRYSSVILDLQV